MTLEPEPTEPPAAPGEPQPEQPQRSDLPLWLRICGVIGSFTLMAGHIAYDAAVDSYEGASISLMLGGLVGATLGVNEFLRNRGGGAS